MCCGGDSVTCWTEIVLVMWFGGSGSLLDKILGCIPQVVSKSEKEGGKNGGRRGGRGG